MTAPRLLVVAKAPVAGEVKTRLGARIGMESAARIAAAALLDTLAAGAAAFGDRCHLALAGDLGRADRHQEIAAALNGWKVFPQSGSDFGARLAHAHATVGRLGSPLVQIGMDTPQVSPELLLSAADGLGQGDAVVGPAEDGGWWLLGLDDPRRAVVLRDVAMSRPDTGDRTVRALEATGLRVVLAERLRDVDTVEDAEIVAALAPGTRFARSWHRHSRAAS